MNKMSHEILQFHNTHISVSAEQLMFVFDISLEQAADYIAYLRKENLIEIDTTMTTNIDNSSKGVFPDTPLKITVAGKSKLEELRNSKKLNVLNGYDI